MVDDDAPTLRDLFSRPAWMDRGACCDVPTPAFFIERGGDQAPARRACAVCVVRSECLAYAMADPELKGYWGGTSERQRRQIRSGAA
jgi:WhiB family redox-sensing transcriptional regulator